MASQTWTGDLGKSQHSGLRMLPHRIQLHGLVSSANVAKACISSRDWQNPSGDTQTGTADQNSGTASSHALLLPECRLPAADSCLHFWVQWESLKPLPLPLGVVFSLRGHFSSLLCIPFFLDTSEAHSLSPSLSMSSKVRDKHDYMRTLTYTWNPSLQRIHLKGLCVYRIGIIRKFLHNSNFKESVSSIAKKFSNADHPPHLDTTFCSFFTYMARRLLSKVVWLGSSHTLYHHNNIMCMSDFQGPVSHALLPMSGSSCYSAARCCKI